MRLFLQVATLAGLYSIAHVQGRAYDKRIRSPTEFVQKENELPDMRMARDAPGSAGVASNGVPKLHHKPGTPDNKSPKQLETAMKISIPEVLGSLVNLVDTPPKNTNPTPTSDMANVKPLNKGTGVPAGSSSFANSSLQASPTSSLPQVVDEGKASGDTVCGCSCLCSTGPMPNGLGMNGMPTAAVFREIIVQGSGNILVNGACACSCICPAGSFPILGNSMGYMSPPPGPTAISAGGSPARMPLGTGIQSPAPTEAPGSSPPQPQSPPSRPQPPPPPPPQGPPPPPPPPPAPPPAPAPPDNAQVAGTSALSLPLQPGVIAPVAAAPPQVNIDPSDIDRFKLSSTLILGISKPTPRA